MHMYYTATLNVFKESSSFELELSNKKERIFLGGTFTGCDYTASLVVIKDREAVYEQSYKSPLWIICEDDEDYISEILADQFVELVNILFETLWSWPVQFTSITVKEMTPRCQVLREEKIIIK